MKLDVEYDDNDGDGNGDVSPDGLSPSSTTSHGDDVEDENYENNYCLGSDNIRIVCMDDTRKH